MKRRQFITLLGGTAAAWPLAARAQQSAMPVIGFLHTGSAATRPHLVAAFRQGLAETGHVEGRNIGIEYRWADDQKDRLPALVADLLRRQVIVIAASGEPAVFAAKYATSTIPTVFIVGDDPAKVGLVASLARPGGNMTGVNLLTIELQAKRLAILHELIPSAAVTAHLVDPTFPLAEAMVAEIGNAARILGRQIVVLKTTSEGDIDAAFAAMEQARAGALLVGAGPFFNSQRHKIVALAARYSIPAIYEFRDSAVVGGLISYGTSLADAHRLIGVYAGRILKGEKPADLPVQQSVKVELVINMNAAKALGLEVPMSLLMRVDEVIE
jgi:putative ABC transport system substrate-binding protein